MSNDNIISIRELKAHNAKISLEDSIKEDVAQGLISPDALASISPVEEEQSSYTITIKKEKGQIIVDLPQSEKDRINNRKTLDDYFYVTREQAMELL